MGVRCRLFLSDCNFWRISKNKSWFLSIGVFGFVEFPAAENIKLEPFWLLFCWEGSKNIRESAAVFGVNGFTMCLRNFWLPILDAEPKPCVKFRGSRLRPMRLSPLVVILIFPTLALPSFFRATLLNVLEVSYPCVTGLLTRFLRYNSAKAWLSWSRGGDKTLPIFCYLWASIWRNAPNLAFANSRFMIPYKLN